MNRVLTVGLLSLALTACMGSDNRAPGFYGPPPPGPVQSYANAPVQPDAASANAFVAPQVRPPRATPTWRPARGRENRAIW